MMNAAIKRAWPAALLALLAALTWLAYAPGLSGGFLFDDFVNLDALGKFGRVDTWPIFWRYITSGTADPIGRPLSLLSFLLDARDWPADPRPFLRSNLLLHIGNGLLLFALLRRLERALGDDGRRDAVALLGAALWMLHPLFVSTTLYIVQREAMLPATFVLLGLLGYVHGRLALANGATRRGLAWMVGSLVLATLCATLAKANGLLLPLLAWVLEYCVLAGAAPPPPAQASRLARFRRLGFLLPALVLLVFLARPLTHLHDVLETRHWSVAQRLLSEPRALADYLHLLLVPRAGSSGLFNDHFPASTDLWHPWTTLPALALVAALLWLAFKLRRRAPALSAALLFFFAGHLLESTSLPLELYFEHRNYLPALLLSWPLARWIAGLRRPRALRLAIGLFACAVLAATTYERASIWGRPEALAALWAKQNPESSRAQAAASISEAERGRPDLAARRLEISLRARPHDLQLAFNLIDSRCAAGGVRESDRRLLAEALRHDALGGFWVGGWLDDALEVAASGQCPGLKLADVEEWITVARARGGRSRADGNAEDFEPLLAHLALLKRQPREALLHFDRALLAYVGPDVAARQAAMLASSGYYEEALAHLDTYERHREGSRTTGFDMSWVHARVLDLQGYWPHEMRLLRSKLRAAIRERDAAAAGAPG